MYNNEPCRETKSEMMQDIKCYNFAILELSLYLDTHPEDQRALCMHKEYCKIYKDLCDKYQKVYGPLTINYPCNKWRWMEEPWGSFILGEKLPIYFQNTTKELFADIYTLIDCKKKIEYKYFIY